MLPVALTKKKEQGRNIFSNSFYLECVCYELQCVHGNVAKRAVASGVAEEATGLGGVLVETFQR